MAHFSSLSRQPEWATVVEVLRQRCAEPSLQSGYCFLVDGETQALELSYAELDRQARAIAVSLLDRQGQGERALLLFPPGLDYIVAFFGCLYARVVAVPVYPPRRNQTLTRLEAIAADAQARFVLTQDALLVDIQQHDLSSFTTVEHWIASDRLDSEQADDWQPPVLSPDSLALLQYTSGSTGQPKGVQISHANLLHNSAIIHRAFEHSPSSRGVIWLPPYHDMGLIGGILQPLYGGFPVVLMSPVSFLQKPLRWLQVITRYQGTTSGGPNFAYERCLEKITAAQIAELDLSSWDVAFTGAEPIRAETLRRFADTFAPCGFRAEAFYPCYGLAEATLFVAGASKSKPPHWLTLSKSALQNHRVVLSASDDLSNFSVDQPVNHPIAQFTDLSMVQLVVSNGRTAQETIIIHPETHQHCNDDQIGEIWLASSTAHSAAPTVANSVANSVAQGYWQQPELTQQIFQARLQNSSEELGKTYLRTGDLGFLHQQELYITGRLKDVIIIRGKNYYPQDIEHIVVQSYPGLASGSGAAFKREHEPTERLVIVQEVVRECWRSIDAEAAITAIRSAISEQLQLQTEAIVLVKPGSIPKTSSGKVKRHACRDGFLKGTLDIIQQWKLGEHGGYSESLESWTDQPVNHTLSTGVAQNLNQQNLHQNILKSEQKTEQLIAWLRDYATHHINSRLMDERRSLAPHVVLDFGNQGLLGMQVPTAYGGLNLGHRSTLRVLEQLGAIDPTLALFVGLNNVLGIRPIARYGTPTLQAELLPLLATGRELAAFALTEAEAGSNPQAIASSAIPHANGWQLTGRKIWSGSAAWAGVINVFVRHPEQQRISGFAVRRGAPGLRQGSEALTMGMRGMVQNTVHLEQVPVQPQDLLGQVGSGMEVAQDAMMYGRLAIGAASLGGMKRCAQLMLRYGQRRTIATGRLLDNPLTLTRLTHLTCAITALESLVTQIAQQLDAEQSVPMEAYTACKIAAPEYYWQAADWLVQILGGRGYIETNLAPQILRDARVLRIFEGPTETLALFLGSRVIHQPQGLQTWLSQALNADDIAQELLSAVEQIRHCPTSFTDEVTARRWKAIQVGELATLSILKSTLKLTLEVTPKDEPNQKKSFRQAASWLERQFEQKLQLSLSNQSNQFKTASAIQLEAEMLCYHETIGDIEQNLAGEDSQLDELLRKLVNSPVQSSPVLADSAPAPSLASDVQSNIPTPAIIQTWLIHWLSQKLQMPARTIDPHKPFADYGIDSVTAVELAQDLETWLHLPQPLEATIAWNFPTIAALAAHLATPSSVPLAAVSVSPSPTLSDAEIAELLTAEIAAARRSRQ